MSKEAHELINALKEIALTNWIEKNYPKYFNIIAALFMAMIVLFIGSVVLVWFCDWWWKLTINSIVGAIAISIGHHLFKSYCEDKRAQGKRN